VNNIMTIRTVEGDLLDQKTDAIVNAWNRNLIPWWLLLPQGVSGAIKARAGYGPFMELRKAGVLPLGGAFVTSAGRLPFKAIIHVAGIGHNWRSSERSIRQSVCSALNEARARDFKSLAFPLIGAGTGGGSPDNIQNIMKDEAQKCDFDGEILIVLYKNKEWPHGHCYCDLWEKNPQTLEKQGVPPGYCGLCNICGSPGHIQNFPGSVPFTGAWCKKHYYRTMFFHPLGTVGFLIWGIGIFVIGCTLFHLIN
jgi:O-acetyl-ADP-ribose deacetylase